MSHHPDVLVVGLGGMGTAAAWQLARRGLRVLGLEQFTLGHDRGSSHGHSRIIRQAYYEHPAYVPLVRRSYELWYDLEQCQGTHLLTGCPCLTLGRPDHELVRGVWQSAAEHALPVEELAAGEVRRRYPAFRVPAEGVIGIVEHSAGFLYVDRCVQAMADEARRLGAVLRDHEPVLGWEPVAGGVRVQTSAGQYSAARLVLTAGPWAAQLLRQHGAALTVMRQVPMWFEPRQPALFRRDRFPVFIAETPAGYFYGLPALDARGVKVARHYGAAEVAGPDAVERTTGPEDEAPVRQFLRNWLPDADGPCRDASVCLYTLTPDRHFVIDNYPDAASVALAAGFSGHGFKFAPVVGEVLADLVTTGKTAWPIELFRLARFAGTSLECGAHEAGRTD